MKAKINKVTILIQQGDTLLQVADALVHPTNPTLSLSKTLATVGGEALINATNQIGWCDIGDAVVTGGGNLPYQFVIHTVPPKWGEGSERGKLANATWEVLRLAELNHCRSIVIPPIATGSEGYPLENCAKTMLEQIVDFTFESLRFLRDVMIYTLLDAEKLVFEAELKRQLARLDDSGDGYAGAR